MRLHEVAKIRIPNVKMKSGFDIELKTDPYGNTDEYYEVTYNGKPIGDIRNNNIENPNFEVVHYDTDLSWDMIDILSDAYELLKDTHREYKGLKESTALSQQYGGKRAKVLSYSQTVRYIAKNFQEQDNVFETVAAIYGRDKKEVLRDAEHARNMLLTNK